MGTIKLHGKALRSAKKLFGEQEIDPMAIIEYPYAVAWKIKIAEKSKDYVVGHVPREISRAVWYFTDKDKGKHIKVRAV